MSLAGRLKTFDVKNNIREEFFSSILICEHTCQLKFSKPVGFGCFLQKTLRF